MDAGRWQAASFKAYNCADARKPHTFIGASHNGALF
jgi:hypothetical protein